LLEQISESGISGGQQFHGVTALKMLGEDDDRQGGKLRANIERGPQPIICPAGRHPNIRDHQIRGVLPGGPNEAGGVGRRRHDVETVICQHPAQALAQQHFVIAYYYAHGRLSLSLDLAPSALPVVTGRMAIPRRSSCPRQAGW
jgi:hypothetical protein